MQLSAFLLSLLTLTATAIPAAIPDVPSSKADLDRLAKSALDQIRGGAPSFQVIDRVAQAFDYDDVAAEAILQSLQEQSQGLSKRGEMSLVKRMSWWEYLYCFSCGTGDYGCSQKCAPP